MKRIFKFVIAILLACIAVLSVSSCASGTKYDSSLTGEGSEISMGEVVKLVDSKSVDDFAKYNGESDYVLIKVKDYGEIVVVLRGDVAPKTVENFKKLVSEGFYNGTVFHRVIENFMIQGGGFESDGGFLDIPIIFVTTAALFLWRERRATIRLRLSFSLFMRQI